MCCSSIQLKLKPFLFPDHLFTMDSNLEQLHSGESQSSIRFRSKMHAYDAHHQKLVEATYVREEARYAEWLRQRNEQRDLIRAVQGPRQNRDH